MHNEYGTSKTVATKTIKSTVQSQQNACDSFFYLRTTFLMNTKVCTCPNAKQFG